PVAYPPANAARVKRNPIGRTSMCRYQGTTHSGSSQPWTALGAAARLALRDHGAPERESIVGRRDGHLPGCAETEQATSERDRTDAEPGPADHEPGEHVGEPMDAEQHPRAADRHRDRHRSPAERRAGVARRPLVLRRARRAR